MCSAIIVLDQVKKHVTSCKKGSETCRWCASVGGNGPFFRMKTELQQVVVEAVLWRVTTNQQHRRVSAYC